jgi:hypothetical protein
MPIQFRPEITLEVLSVLREGIKFCTRLPIGGEPKTIYDRAARKR